MNKNIEKQNFHFTIERDQESQWLIAEVIELPGCYTQAENLADLERNIREAIEVYLETVSEDNPTSQFIGTYCIEV